MNKPFTFLITPGRSGSSLLQSMLNTIDGVFAEESYFTVNGRGMRHCFSSIVGKRKEYRDDFYERKIDYISGLKCDHYVDTCSLVCQDNNIEQFIERGHSPNIITLRRDPRLVAKSYYELNWNVVKPRLSSVTPSDDGVVKMTLKNPHEYQECLWYCFEIERLARQYKLKLELWGIKHYETSLDKILNNDEFNIMMDFFGLPHIDNIPQDPVNNLKESKIRSLSAEEMISLTEELIVNLKHNNDFDDTFFDV